MISLRVVTREPVPLLVHQLVITSIIAANNSIFTKTPLSLTARLTGFVTVLISSPVIHIVLLKKRGVFSLREVLIGLVIVSGLLRGGAAEAGADTQWFALNAFW